MKLRALVVCALVLAFATVGLTPAFATGSASLYPTNAACTGTGSCRAALEFRTGTYGPSGSLIQRRTILSVFAQAGETIDLGSSAVGIGSGDAVLFNPGVITDDQATPLPTLVAGTNGFSCIAQRTASGIAGQGQITSRALELAGPQAVTGGGNPGGYVPCHVTATTTGIYKVIFYGPAGAASNADPTGYNADINLGTAAYFGTGQNSETSAWDVTVRASDTSTTDIPGRLFTYALSAITANNGRPVNSSVYVTTSDGYRYRVDTNGLDPNGFLMYANERGFVDSDGVTPLNHDVLGSSGALTTLTGSVKLAAPQYPLSFEPLAAVTLAALSIPANPTAPTISNLSFTGKDPSRASYVGEGGTFTFTQNVHGTYSLIISRDGVNFDPGNPLNAVLRGITEAGTHTITWDGNDNVGDAFPIGTNYQVKAQIEGGVYHFPLIDAENSIKGGPSFTLLNPPGGTCPFGNSACTTAFYDDRGYETAGGTAVGTPGAALCGLNPPATDHSDPVNGYVSTSTQRAWGANPGSNTNANCTGSFGDAKGLDTWTYFPSTNAAAALDIIGLPTPPKATDDTVSTPVDTKLTVPATDGLLANDTGTDVTVTAHTDPADGSVTVAADGAFTYTPDPSFIGTDSFTYTITDSAGQTATATVRISVGALASTGADVTGIAAWGLAFVAAGGGVLALTRRRRVA